MINYINCSYVSLDGILYPTVELLAANSEDDEFCAIVAKIKKDETRMIGGGASPLIAIRGEVEAAR